MVLFRHLNSTTLKAGNMYVNLICKSVAVNPNSKKTLYIYLDVTGVSNR